MEVDLTRAIILQNKEFNGLETSRSADPTEVLDLCQGHPELRRGVEKLVASRKRWKQQAQDREVSDVRSRLAEHRRMHKLTILNLSTFSGLLLLRNSRNYENWRRLIVLLTTE